MSIFFLPKAEGINNECYDLVGLIAYQYIMFLYIINR